MFLNLNVFMSMSDHCTSIKPEPIDETKNVQRKHFTKLIPNHTIEMKSTLCKRGNLKHIDKKNRTHYIKLDCKIKNNTGNTVQVFNRFILLDDILDQKV